MDKKALSLIFVLLLGTAMLLGALRSPAPVMYEAGNEGSMAADPADADKNTLLFWYADDSLTEYLQAAALAYQAETGTHVTLKEVSGVDYLEQINTASVYDGETGPDGEILQAPDLYLTTHDTLMRAYLAGLADEISDPHEAVIPENFPETAIHAITCDEKHVAYPLYYETNFFLYNKTYMRDIASAKVEADLDQAIGEAAQEQIDSGEVDP